MENKLWVLLLLHHWRAKGVRSNPSNPPSYAPGLQEVKNSGKSLTVKPKNWSRSFTGGGRLLEVPTVRLWLVKFWCFWILMLWRFDCIASSLSLACSAVVFFGRANVLLEKRGENGASQKERGRGREERKFFFLSPSPLSFFRPSTYP